MTLAKSYQNTTPRPPGMSRGMYFANYMFGPSRGGNNMVFLSDTLGPSSQERLGATAAGRRLYGGGSPIRGGWGGAQGLALWGPNFHDSKGTSRYNFTDSWSDVTGNLMHIGDWTESSTRILGGLGDMIGAGKAIGQKLGFGGSQIPMGMYPSGGDNFHLQPRMAYPQAPAYSYGYGAMGGAPTASRYSDAGGPPKVIKGIDSTGPAAQALYAYVKDQDGMHLERTSDGVTIHFDNEDAAFAFGAYYSSHLKHLVQKEKASNPSGAGSEAAASSRNYDFNAIVQAKRGLDADADESILDELNTALDNNDLSDGEKINLDTLIRAAAADDAANKEKYNALLEALGLDEITEDS